MKKRGITLSEILITLSVIGVVSALIMPFATSNKPDHNKARFIKVYDNIAKSIKDFAGNTRLFPVCSTVNGANVCFPGYPFFNTEGDEATIGVAGGTGKLCRLLALEYLGENNNNTCSNRYSVFSNANRNFNFTLPTGESFYVTTNRGVSAGNERARTQIVFDIDGNGNGVDCIYDDNCSKPDTFVIWVAADGQITPGDRATEYYLRTRKNLKTKKIDVRNNADIDPPAGRVVFMQ